MGKASRKKRRDEAAGAPPQPLAEPPGWSGPVLLVASAAGVVLAAVSTWVHYQVTTSGGAYASFCNMGGAINCDSVVTSSWANLFGIPVSIWALAFYLLLGAVALRAIRSEGESRERARADAFGLAVAGAGFSVWMAFLSIAVLETLCILCAGLYAASALSVLGAWKLASPPGRAIALLRRRFEIARRRPALATGSGVVMALVIFLPGWFGAPALMTRQEVFQSNPRFFDWYLSQPLIDDPPVEGRHARGPDDAPIQLVEFSDFECPHCSRAHVTLKDLLSRYSEKVRFVFHHFPLSNQCNDAIPHRGHEHACRAAIAAECAGEQEKFDAFTNLLFANQDDLGPSVLERLVSDVGLDAAAFEKCLEGKDAAGRIQADVDAGKRAGVRSTPTFFINGRRIEGNLQYQDWLFAFAIELDKG